MKIEDDNELNLENLNFDIDDDIDDIIIDDIIIDEIDVIEIIDIVDISDDVILSKHKVEGKHSLQYDSIFKGKKDEVETDDEYAKMEFQNDSFEIDRGSILYDEYRTTEQYIREKNIKEKVYNVLSEKTDLNFMNNRRKPSKVDFNEYYRLLTVDLRNERFTNIELFNELAVYFSDNLLNMFKLLDNKWRNQVIAELQEHIGKNINNSTITNRNLHIDTEIEFSFYDCNQDCVKYITGIIIETDYINSVFTVNSFENIYSVEIENIVKILNNKYKFNLNMLNNVDFL